MNNDLISREALKRAIESPCWTKWEWKFLCECIDNAPTINTTCPNCDSGYAQGYSDGYLKGKEDRPHGKWIDVDEDWFDYKCSICSLHSRRYWDFCPNCGAKMDGKEASCGTDQHI